MTRLYTVKSPEAVLQNEGDSINLASVQDVFNVKDIGAKGDGIADDSIAINAAISAAQKAGGGVVFFPYGTYMHNSDLTVTGNNITLAGEGRGSIIKNGTGNTANGLLISGATHVVIKDVAIDGNKANIVSPPTIGTQYLTLNGIFITGSTDVTVTGCYVHDFYDMGVGADTSTALLISNNYVANGNDNGIFIRTSPNTGLGCNDVTISGNICTGMAFSGIQAIFASYVTIANNVSYSNGPTAAQGDGVGIEGCSYVTIANNVCYSNGIQGINVRYSTETPSATNTKCTHVAITNNVCYNHTSTNGDAGGMVISAVDDIVVTGNLVYANYVGVNVTDTNALSVTNLYFGNNVVRSNTNVGVRVASTAVSTLLFADNFVADNTAENMYASTRVFVQGGIYKSTTGANKSGIKLDTGSDGSVIEGAMVYDNTDNGILVNAGANQYIRNCWFANIVGTNQGRGVYESGGAGPTTLLHNEIVSYSNEPYHLSNAASRYYDFQTSGTTTVTTTPYVVIANDKIVLVNKASAVAVTIPNPAHFTGRDLTIKDVSGAANTNNITVTGAAGNIDGAANKVINTAYGILRLTNDGTNWFTL